MKKFQQHFVKQKGGPQCWSYLVSNFTQIGVPRPVVGNQAILVDDVEGMPEAGGGCGVW